MTIVRLTDARAARQPHWSGPCVCLGCRHEWTGGGPEGASANLECPACRLPKGTVKYPFGAGEGDMVLVCSHCGGEALTAYRRGAYNFVRCMGCGVDLTDEFYE